MIEEDQEIKVLKSVAHSIKKSIVSSLTDGSRTFSCLMLDCGLDPGSETGIFQYHLYKLTESKFN